MPKTYIVHIGHTYPYNFSKTRKLQSNSVIKIKRQLPLREVTKQLSSKILFVNNLKNKNLIKIQSIEQTTKYIEITYQYLQIQNFHHNYQSLQNKFFQLQNFVLYLINVGIKCNLNLDRMGITKQGLFKYYIGFQFELIQNDQQDIIHQHYQQQIIQLKKQFQKHQLDQSINQQILQIPHQQLQWPQINQPKINQKLRKASLITLPSNISNLTSLNKQLNKIQTSVKQITQYKYKQNTKQLHKNIQNYQTYNNTNLLSNTNKDFSYQYYQNYEKDTNRKHSGDSKSIINRKLSIKLSGFSSQRNKSKQSNHNSMQLDNHNIKSKVEQLKYKQYIQLVQSKNSYLNDFINVLEDSPSQLMTNIQTTPYTKVLAINKKSPRQFDYPTSASSSNSKNQTQMLKVKAQQSIKNSLKLINKVRGIC